MGSKGSAVAHPIQGLVKYHGKIDERLRLPSHNSISVNMAPIKTHTTVEFREDLSSDTLEVDGRNVEGGGLDRAARVLDALRGLAGVSQKAKVVSSNDFPSDVGIGSSASGFAALAKSAAASLGLEVTSKDLSAVARLGSGSASRSVAGGFSEWVMATQHRESVAYRLDEGDVPLRSIIAVSSGEKDLPTTGSQKETESSPLYSCRLGYIPDALLRMREAISDSDVSAIGEIAEEDTLNMHAVTMTGPAGLVLWRPETVSVIRAVKEMRENGAPVYYSIDTGGSVFVNTESERLDEVEAELEEIDEVSELIRCRVGGPAKEVSDHLF